MSQCELSAINQLQDILHLFKPHVNGDRVSVTQATKLLRDRGAQSLASRLGKLSKTHNGSAHPDMTLSNDVHTLLSSSEIDITEDKGINSSTDATSVIDGDPVSAMWRNPALNRAARRRCRNRRRVRPTAARGRSPLPQERMGRQRVVGASQHRLQTLYLMLKSLRVPLIRLLRSKTKEQKSMR